MNPPRLELISHGWRGAFRGFLASVRKELIVVSPYIRRREAEFVADNLQKGADIAAITSLDERSLLGGALEIGALNILGGFSGGSQIINLPRLHAKIYVADRDRAIITSANLTTSGIEHNYEYGVGISDRGAVRQIRGHIADYRKLGNLVAAGDLAVLEEKIRAVRQKQQDTEKRKETREAKELRAAVRALDDECQRLHIGNDAPTSLFKKALRYILTDDGLTTKEIQEEIRRLYPGLCSDNADRVINGKHFGKLWKHHLRNAQLGLKTSGEFAYDKNTKKWRRTAPRF
ncbi:MAG: hypothetical protein HAW59_07095 [Betaproteobacteria bacterium]|nr:hypothetical protein [Betaproteobacteria bacterium]